MEIREFAWSDYAAVQTLWVRLNMWRPEMDNRAALAGCLAHNPGLFLVAADPAAGAIAGTTLGTFDGRRGYLYHVGVDLPYRRQGIGRNLVATVIDRLWACGAAKVSLRVHAQNPDAIAFYASLGLGADTHVLGMSIERVMSDE